MTLSDQVSFGDLIVAGGLVGSVIYNYSIVSTTLRALRTQVEDLRRGRGLIMGENSDWPLAVRRCFGMVDDHTREHH